MNDSDIVTDPDEMKRTLQEMIELVESGEMTSCSLRVYKKDGTWEDLTFGDTEEDRAAALAELHRKLAGLH